MSVFMSGPIHYKSLIGIIDDESSWFFSTSKLVEFSMALVDTIEPFLQNNFIFQTNEIFLLGYYYNCKGNFISEQSSFDKLANFWVRIWVIQRAGFQDFTRYLWARNNPIPIRLSSSLLNAFESYSSSLFRPRKLKIMQIWILKIKKDEKREAIMVHD